MSAQEIQDMVGDAADKIQLKLPNVHTGKSISTVQDELKVQKKFKEPNVGDALGGSLLTRPCLTLHKVTAASSSLTVDYISQFFSSVELVLASNGVSEMQSL